MRELQNVEVRQPDAYVGRGHVADRTRRAVRRDRQPGGLGYYGYLLELEHSADRLHVGMRISTAPASMYARFRARPTSGLAAGKGHLGRPAQLCEVVERPRNLFQPVEIQRLQALQQVVAAFEIEITMRIHQQIPAGADHFSHGLDASDSEPGMRLDFGGGTPQGHAVERSHLHRIEARIDRAARRGGETVGSARFGRTVDVGVIAHRIAQLAAEELAAGNARGLPLKVVERLLDPTERARGRAAVLGEPLLRHRAQRLDVVDASPRQPLTELFEQGNLRIAAPGVRSLAQPGQSLVGMHLDEYPIAAAVDAHADDLDRPHGNRGGVTVGRAGA